MELLDTPEDKIRRGRLIKQLAASGITSQPVLDAMQLVPRHFFVPPELRKEAYLNSALPIGENQTISQPYVVARMTELIFDSLHSHKVLEIGTGSGYQAAVLAHLYEKVYTVERIQSLLKRAKAGFRALHLENIHAFYRDGYAGYFEDSPYDAIIATAVVPKIPDSLFQQLAQSGRLIIPLEHVSAYGSRSQFLVLARKSVSGIEISIQDEVRFVPMLGGLL